jgi:hypothetical protein
MGERESWAAAHVAPWVVYATGDLTLIAKATCEDAAPSHLSQNDAAPVTVGAAVGQQEMKFVQDISSSSAALESKLKSLFS